MPRSKLHLADALGHDSSDKRLDILRRVGEAGSISQAARGAGVSYKAAWQAVETLSNLAGAPLVDKAVGGSGGGGAVLTAAGQRVLQAAQAMNQARQQVLAQLALTSAASAGSATPGQAAMALRTSMRNQFPCQVQGLTRQAGAVRVQLALGESQSLDALITRESADLLGLSAGQSVLALCKATAVRIGASPGEMGQAAGCNRLAGRISRGTPLARGGQASLALPSGLQIVGLCAAGQGLARSRIAWACFEPSAVVIALPS